MFKRIAAITVFCCCCALAAAPWFTHSSRRRPETLLVTGNYFSPYMLAETYQGLTNQPYLRIMEDGRLYMVMPKLVRGIAPRELGGVINNFRFKRIVIIGDERYVSADLEKELRKSNVKATPIVRIYGDNWLRVAEELDDLLNVGHLTRNFRENLQEASIRTQPVQLQLRQRNTAPEKKAEAVKAEEAAPEVKPVPAEPVPAEPAPAAEPVDPAPVK